MKKVTKKSVFTAILVLAFALVVMVYMMFYTKYNDQTDALKKSNKALKEQVDELYVYYENRTQYRTDTANMLKGVNDMTLDYTSQANEEDFIMTAVAMQAAGIINYEKVNIDTEEVIHTVPQETVKGAEFKIPGAEEGAEAQPIEFYQRNATYANVTDYANLKKCLEVVYNNPYRVGINNVSYKREKDENNFIKGTIDITYYTIQGMGKDYEYPAMDTYMSGVQDLFGKIVLLEGEERESSED